MKRQERIQCDGRHCKKQAVTTVGDGAYCAECARKIENNLCHCGKPIPSTRVTTCSAECDGFFKSPSFDPNRVLCSCGGQIKQSSGEEHAPDCPNGPCASGEDCASQDFSGGQRLVLINGQAYCGACALQKAKS